MVRKWRVGTFSMGVSLILLGVMLFLSQLNGKIMLDSLLNWWPLVFCMLGAEILLYLFVGHRGENPTIHYDIVSVLFVGVMSMMAFAFAALTSTGIITELHSVVSAVERSYPLPEVRQAVPSNVKKVVVQNADRHVKLDTSNENMVHVFGSYRTSDETAGLSLGNHPEVFVMDVRVVGDTMYVPLGTLPIKQGVFATYSSRNLTVIVPEGLEVEFRGANNETIEKP